MMLALGLNVVLHCNLLMDLVWFGLDCLFCTFVLCPTSGIPLILLSLHQVSLIVHLCPLVIHLSFLFSPLQRNKQRILSDI